MFAPSRPAPLNGYLAGRMFSDTPELAYHVVKGIENRAAKNGHVAQLLSVEPALQIATWIALIMAIYLPRCPGPIGVNQVGW